MVQYTQNSVIIYAFIIPFLYLILNMHDEARIEVNRNVCEQCDIRFCQARV